MFILSIICFLVALVAGLNLLDRIQERKWSAIIFAVVLIISLILGVTFAKQVQIKPDVTTTMQVKIVEKFSSVERYSPVHYILVANEDGSFSSDFKITAQQAIQLNEGDIINVIITESWEGTNVKLGGNENA